MKITRRSSIQTPVTGAAGPATPLGGGPARAGETSGSRDSVELSATARLMQRLRGEVGDVDAMATERVRELQHRVDANEYHPPARAVAERMLSELASDALA